MDNAPHHDAAPSPDDLFPAAEWHAFRHADALAAKAIVVLITSIFVVGIILYTIVAASL